jgi:hypothetical protein
VIDFGQPLPPAAPAAPQSVLPLPPRNPLAKAGLPPRWALN